MHMKAKKMPKPKAKKPAVKKPVAVDKRKQFVEDMIAARKKGKK
jgi:hypothetical protein